LRGRAKRKTGELDREAERKHLKAGGQANRLEEKLTQLASTRPKNAAAGDPEATQVQRAEWQRRSKSGGHCSIFSAR